MQADNVDHGLMLQGSSHGMGHALLMSSLSYQLQACSATANSIHLIASNLTGHACWMVETPRLRFMVHVFSCEGYSKAEVLFRPPIVNLTSSMVQDMLQWGWKLEGSKECN